MKKEILTKKIRFYISILFFVALVGCNDNGIFVNHFGQIKIKSNSLEELNIDSLIQKGWVLKKDPDIYISEGILAKENDSYYRVDGIYNNELFLYIEIYNDTIYRIVVLTSNIPVITKEGETIRVGDSILSTINKVGKFSISKGEDPGSYLSYSDLHNISIYTNCDLTQIKTENMMKESQYKRCLIQNIIALGNEGMVFK